MLCSRLRAATACLRSCRCSARCIRCRRWCWRTSFCASGSRWFNARACSSRLSAWRWSGRAASGYPRRVASRTDIFDLGRLQLTSGQARQVGLEIELERLEFGGQRYQSKTRLTPARLDAVRTAGGYSLRLRYATTLDGPCMRCLEPSETDLAIDAREIDQPGGGEEMRSPYVDGDRLHRGGRPSGLRRAGRETEGDAAVATGDDTPACDTAASSDSARKAVSARGTQQAGVDRRELHRHAALLRHADRTRELGDRRGSLLCRRAARPAPVARPGEG